MKTDLITSIGVAILGTIISYFVCNMFIGEIKPKSIMTVDGSVSATLANPDPELFNYRALNPTVETYIGECDQLSENGECLDEDTPNNSDDSDIEDNENTGEESDNETENEDTDNNTEEDQDNNSDNEVPNNESENE